MPTLESKANRRRMCVCDSMRSFYIVYLLVKCMDTAHAYSSPCNIALRCDTNRQQTNCHTVRSIEYGINSPVCDSPGSVWFFIASDSTVVSICHSSLLWFSVRNKCHATTIVDGSTRRRHTRKIDFYSDRFGSHMNWVKNHTVHIDSVGETE